jgi:hypothetical protein
MASQAPDLRQCEIGITPFDCPRDKAAPRAAGPRPPRDHPDDPSPSPSAVRRLIRRLQADALLGRLGPDRILRAAQLEADT